MKVPQRWTPELNYSKKQFEVIEYGQNPTGNAILLVGSIRSGKTYAATEAFYELWKNCEPGEQCLIAGQSEYVARSEIYPRLYELAEADGKRIHQSYHNLVLIDVNYGPKITLNNIFEGHGPVATGIFGTESDVFKRAAGLTVKHIYGEEVTLWHESMFKYLLGRMSYDDSQFIGATNPDVPSHYLKKEYIDEGFFDHVWTFNLDDNPWLTEKVKERYRKSLHGVFYERYILARWVVGENAIYPRYSTCDCVEQLMKDGRLTDWVIGIDYGIVDPFVTLPIARIEGGWVHPRTKEIAEWVAVQPFRTQKSDRPGGILTDAMLVDETMTFIKRTCGIKRPRVVVPPEAESFKGALRLAPRREWNSLNAYNEIIPGIRRTDELLSNGQLVIDSRASTTIDELDGYEWDADAAKLAPLDGNDHDLDALRYAVMELRRTRGGYLAGRKRQ